MSDQEFKPFVPAGTQMTEFTGRALVLGLLMSVILGAKTIQQLDDNLAAADLTLSAEEIAALDEVSALKPEYPGWMLARQSEGRVPAAKA